MRAMFSSCTTMLRCQTTNSRKASTTTTTNISDRERAARGTRWCSGCACVRDVRCSATLAAPPLLTTLLTTLASSLASFFSTFHPRLTSITLVFAIFTSKPLIYSTQTQPTAMIKWFIDTFCTKRVRVLTTIITKRRHDELHRPTTPPNVSQYHALPLVATPLLPNNDFVCECKILKRERELASLSTIYIKVHNASGILFFEGFARVGLPVTIANAVYQKRTRQPR
jgi:hypothetical protein